jgi:hypothetical protein
MLHLLCWEESKGKKVGRPFNRPGQEAGQKASKVKQSTALGLLHEDSSLRVIEKARENINSLV